MSEYLAGIPGERAEDQGKGGLFRSIHRKNGEKWPRSWGKWKKMRWGFIEASLYKSVFFEKDWIGRPNMIFFLTVLGEKDLNL